MLKNFENRDSIFAEVVAVDAWHINMSDGTSRADLYADVVFGTARIGGEEESPIRFRLRIKRAELVVVVPESEPMSVDKASVSRDSPATEGRVSRTFETASKAGAKGGASMSVSPTGISATASAEVSGQADASATEKLELSSSVQSMMVTQSRTRDGHYVWLIEPLPRQESLGGRPWDASKFPRLRLIDNRKDRSVGIPPVVRVEVRCRREDLAVFDLSIKDENLWDVVRNRVGFGNRMAAAESYIRNCLESQGLSVRNIHEKFGEMTLVTTSIEIE